MKSSAWPGSFLAGVSFPYLSHSRIGSWWNMRLKSRFPTESPVWILWGYWEGFCILYLCHAQEMRPLLSSGHIWAAVKAESVTQDVEEREVAPGWQYGTVVWLLLIQLPFLSPIIYACISLHFHILELMFYKVEDVEGKAWLEEQEL